MQREDDQTFTSVLMFRRLVLRIFVGRIKEQARIYMHSVTMMVYSLS
jgi:hypothetical protein